MALIVVDNSALLPLFLSDEADDYTHKVIRHSATEATLIAPTLCLLEFGNGILKAVRQNRLTEAEAAYAHRKLMEVPITFRDFVGPATVPLIHSVAQRRRLSFYDGAYLTLALAENAKLASLDGPLNEAAKAEGIELV